MKMTPISLIFPTSRVTPEILNSLNNLVLACRESEAIIVIDGHGFSETGMLQSFYWMGEKLRVIAVGEQKGPAFCRNLGANSARNNTLVFCDYDVVIPVHSFQRLSQVRAGEVLLPSVHPVDARKKPARFFSDQPLAPKKIGGKTLGASACFSITKTDFHIDGGFDQNFLSAAGEDWDFFRRIQDFEVAVVYAREVMVFHDNPATIVSLMSRSFRYGLKGHPSESSSQLLSSQETTKYTGVFLKMGVIIMGISRYFLATSSIEGDTVSKLASRINSLEESLVAKMGAKSIANHDTQDFLSKGVVAVREHASKSPWSSTLHIDDDAQNRYRTYRLLILLWRISFVAGLISRSLTKFLADRR